LPYLLDGNNLIGLVRRTDRPSDEDRQALVAELAGRLRATRARAVLFFDGPAGERGSSLGSLSVRPATGSADDAILAEIRKAASPAECIVVTADRGLAGRARDLGAKICAPSEFFARFGSGAGKSEQASERVDVEDWLRWFGDEENRETDSDR
jgi:hypothetical protein